MSIIEIKNNRFEIQPCKNCESDKVEYVAAYEPWYNAHLMCTECDSTFPLFDEEIAKQI